MGKPLPKPLVLWKPNAGPQTALVNCPVYEVFFGGARGGGKTEGMLGDWLLHQARYGEFAHGVFFRKTLIQLDQVISRAKRLFTPLGAKWAGQSKVFSFPSGATLKFRYLDGVIDAENYQGHEYTRIYFEEVTNWANADGIDMLRATLRSGAGVPCLFRATGNPGGVGHSWVKQRYIDAGLPMQRVIDEASQKARVFIPSKLADNPYLGTDYEAGLKQVGTPELVKAWLLGDWNVIAGAFFGSIWDSNKHVIEPFDIPKHWRRWRSMDWGSARPYAVLWFAQDEDGTVYVYRELYGIKVGTDGRWQPNKGTREPAEDVAKVVNELEAAEKQRGIDIQGNPADPAIWANIGAELSIEEHFRKQRVIWQKADNAAGSRVAGAQEVTRRLTAGTLKFFRSCQHTVRTVSTIPVSARNPEDVDTDSEDHAYDALRYGIRRRKQKTAEPEQQQTDPNAWLKQLG